MTWTAAVLTVSDSRAAGAHDDTVGPALAATLAAAGFAVRARELVPDDPAALRAALERLCDRAALVLTTGGTGLGPRDVTPEVTRAVGDREVPGLAERMRAEGARQTPLAALSRAVVVQRGRTLIVNLPGSPKGAAQSLAAVLDLLPHALRVIAGPFDHDAGGGSGSAGD